MLHSACPQFEKLYLPNQLNYYLKIYAMTFNEKTDTKAKILFLKHK